MMTNIAFDLDTLEHENFEHKPFIPFNKLEALFTHDKVLELLKQHDLEFHLIDETVKRVLNEGLKTFATLTTVQDIRSITRFIKKDQFFEISLNARLPLKETDISRYFSNSEKGKLFLCRQWSFLAPIFFENQSRCELNDRIILSFLKKILIDKDGFAKIYRVTIHRSHHMLDILTEVDGLAMLENTQHRSMSTQLLDIDLICKQLERSDDKEILVKEFDHEVSILFALRCLQHSHIIRLIIAFTKGTIHNFLFPVANEDLEDLLNFPHRSLKFRNQIEIFESLWELFSALESVHNFFFPQLNIRQVECHYDIKSKNILFSNEKLLLSDFDLSQLRMAKDGSQTTFKAGEEYYMMSECEIITNGFKRERIERASDVWFLSCVLAEILAYLSVESTKGSTAVQSFTEDRRLKVESCIFYIFFENKEINSDVQRFLKHCKQNSSDELRLLTEIVNKILQFDSDQRFSAVNVTRLLFHLTQQTRVFAITSTLSTDVKSLNLELKIEMKRLRIWSEMIRLNADSLNVPCSTWFAMNHSFDEYKNLQLLLINIQIEIDVIATELQKTFFSQPAFRLYYRLQQLQNQLWDDQPLAVHRMMFDRLKETMLSKNNSTQFQEISKLAQETLSNSLDEDSSSSSIERICRRFACLATMRSVASAIVRQDHQNQDLRLNREFIKRSWFDLDSHQIDNLELENKSVLIKFLTYEMTWSSREDELLKRVNAIAFLRSKSVFIFPILRCCDYYSKPTRSRFDIVYKLLFEAQNTVLINFVTILKRTEARTLQSSLTQRYKLAIVLILHVLSFHRDGWLHKGISALNIICFSDAFPSIATSLSIPYFIDFNHSRVNDDNAYSSLSELEMKYQHSVYQGNALSYANNSTNLIVRFRQKFDYYSVGMMLMKIVFWTSLKLITARIEKSRKKMLAKLLKKYVSVIKMYMSNIYDVAIQYCLTIYVKKQKKKYSLENIRDDFNENVVMFI